MGRRTLRYKTSPLQQDSHECSGFEVTGNDITTGVQNTLIGSQLGDAITDADENVAVGYIDKLLIL